MLKDVLSTHRGHSLDRDSKDAVSSNKILIRNCEKSRKSKRHLESFNDFSHSVSINHMNDQIDNARKSFDRSKQNESVGDTPTEFDEHMKDK